MASAQQVLDEVNAARAARGLAPFQLDEGLARGATAWPVFRAQNRIEGHTPNDFRFLPPRAHARAGGCAAWPVGMGWGSCCTYDNYQFAGAAFCVGPDGRRTCTCSCGGSSDRRARELPGPAGPASHSCRGQLWRIVKMDQR